MSVSLKELILGLVAIAAVPGAWHTSGLAEIYPAVTMWVNFLGGLAALILPVVKKPCPKQEKEPEAIGTEGDQG
jgi:hypothetical protein